MYKGYWNILKFKDYDQYRSQMNKENRNGISLLLNITVFVCLMNTIIHIMIKGFDSFTLPMIIIFCYIVFISVFYFGYLKKQKISFTFFIFAFQAPVYIYSIMMGTLLDPSHAAYSFPLLMIVLPLFIIARPRYVMAHILFYSLLFMAIDFWAKPLAVAHLDFLHVANATLMAMGAAAFLLVIRIRNMKYATKLKEKSMTDALTGAYNRAGFKSAVNLKRPGLFIFMDVDDFKNINDTYGHAVGDQVLIQLSHVLSKNFRVDDRVARFGGDEFGVYCPGRFDEDIINKKFTGLMKDISHIELPSASAHVTVSIGIVVSRGEYASLDDIMRQADKQMYYVKTHGKNNYQSVFKR